MRAWHEVRGLPSFRTARAAFASAVALVLTSNAIAAPPVAMPDPLAPDQQRAKFTLPAGFEIQLVAAEPQIQKPMNMAFDARGRLWVTHSVEYPFAAKAGIKARDGLTILEDFGPDGRARKATLFADELNIPIGVLPLPRPPEGKTAAIVWSIPHIWKLTDTDDDGKADQREILYGPFDFADTHGNQNSFRLGADGWVYANHGFKNQSQARLRGEGKVVLELKSGNTYRFRPDGSAIEHVTWGQVNPFGMCFDALGNRFNADCHTRPLTMLLPGGRYQSLFAARNADYDDGLGAAPVTTTDGHGSTGIAAVAFGETDRLPEAYQGNAFVGNVVTRRVHRDPIAWRGSSPWVEKPADFLTCDDPWFRPVDMYLGPDGGLYIADFYNFIIAHYEVRLDDPRRDRHRGRIWRVVWNGEAGTAAAEPGVIVDLTKLSTEVLAARLGDPNETVRRLAMEEVVERGRGDAAVAEMLRRTSPSEFHRARAVRALALLGKLDAATIAAAVADESRLVRVHVVQALGGLTDWTPSHADAVCGRLVDPDPFVRRAAAESLARHPMRSSIQSLISCWGETPTEDAQLIHALRIALKFQLTALEQRDWAGIDATGDAAARLCEIAVTVPHAVAAARAVEIARGQQLPGKAWPNLLRSVWQRCSAEQIEAAVRTARTACGTDMALQADLLLPLLSPAPQSGRGPETSPEIVQWAVDFAIKTLATGGQGLDGDRLTAACAVVKELKDPRLAGTWDPLWRIARKVDVKEAERMDAIAALLAVDSGRTLDAAAALIATGTEPYPVRIAFARQCGPEDAASMRTAIGAALKSAGAAQQKELAMALVTRKAGGEELLGLVTAGKVSALLLQDAQVLGRLKLCGIAGLDSRIKTLTVGLQPTDKRIEQVIRDTAGKFAEAAGSVATGAEVFTKNCAACHRLADRGGLIGPQLDGVGQRGPERLLEDILDPSRNVDEAFRTTTVTLADGRVVSGLQLREEGAHIVFADATGKEVLVPKEEIEETATSPVSPMPANMIDQVGEANLPHLIAYLLQQAAGTSP
ncbi:MAG: PVC-type heme-binding CxxCH protein [Planctomycetia bacterium]